MDAPKRRTSKLTPRGKLLDKELAALNEELKGAKLKKVLKTLGKKP